MAPEPAILSERLPHSPPALLLTSASVDHESSTARGVRSPPEESGSAEAVDLFSQMLLMELMSQTAGLVLPSGTRGAVVAAINGMVLNPCPCREVPVETEARLERRIGSLYIFKCKAESGGTVLASGYIVLRAL